MYLFLHLLVVQLQRAVVVRRVCADLLERTPRLQALSPPRTKEVVHWCRLRGYTPPDPEPQRAEENSIEDILTQIDSEPGECRVSCMYVCVCVCCILGRDQFIISCLSLLSRDEAYTRLGTDNADSLVMAH